MPVFHITFEMEPPPELTARDDAASTASDSPVTVPVLANDTYGDEPVSLSDLDGPPTIETQPQNGTVAVNADGTITYTPNPGFTGTDTFEYRITKTPPPPPETCIILEMEPNIADIWGYYDAPNWFEDAYGDFELEWEENGEVYNNTWLHRGGYWEPADGPVPDWCNTWNGTLRQRGNEICAIIEVGCPE